MASLNQIRRLLNLLDHLRDEKAYNARQLADRLNVSRRTLFRDLRALAKLGFVMNYDEQAGRYTVTTEDAKEGAEIPTDELKALLLLGQKLENVDNLGDGDEGVSRLAQSLPDLIGMRPDGTAASEAGEVYPNLIEGLVGGNRVRLVVATDQSQQTATVAPYRFVFSHGRWYLAGHDSGFDRVRFLPLDQVIASELTTESFAMPPADELALAIEVAWQTDIEPGETHEVIVRFSSLIARDVAARRWFRSQEIAWLDDGSLELRTHTALLDRVTSWVLSFGAEASVVGPAPLREKVHTHVKRMCGEIAPDHSIAG